MVIYSPSKWAFLQNGRTGSHSVSDALRRGGWTRYSVHHSSTYTDGWRYFTTVRNHWDAIASMMCMTEWRTDKNGLMTVDDLEKMLKSMFVFFRVGGHLVRHDIPALWKWVNTIYDPVVIRYENLRDDLDTLLTENNLPPAPEFKHINYTGADRQGRHYSEFYTPETAAWVGERFAEEIAELGYKYEEPS